MKAVIHQPTFFPYPGFFHKLTLGDVFVVMDDVQYDKRFTNRNKIIATNGWTWITVPIKKEHKFSQNLDVEINNEMDWRDLIWKKIFHSYKSSKYFELYKNELEEVFNKEWTHLFDLNFETLKKVISWLGIKIEIVRESELKPNGTSTDRLIDVCKKIDADTYISGIGGKNYMDESLFEKNNLKFIYQDYSYTEYPQHMAKEFVPNLSILDMLFNVGEQSLDLLKKNNQP